MGSAGPKRHREGGVSDKGRMKTKEVGWAVGKGLQCVSELKTTILQALSQGRGGFSDACDTPSLTEEGKAPEWPASHPAPLPQSQGNQDGK